MGYAHVVLLALAFYSVFLAVSYGRAEQKNQAVEFVQLIRQGRLRLVDLTHHLDESSPFWGTGNEPSPFHARAFSSYQREGYFDRTLQLPEHFGTHMDAPLHFEPNGASLDQIEVEKFIVPAAVVDVSAAAASNPDYRLTVADLEQWVSKHGPMPSGCAVLISTGWVSRWPSHVRYLNEDAHGVKHFPGLTVEAARYLLDHARPVVIGLDTPSLDYGLSKDYEVHHLTMAAGLYHLENLANLDLLPATGACIIALPMKLRGGSGSPARVLALVP